MITAKEAYGIIKECAKMPITNLIETRESFLSITEAYLSVSKATGESEIFYNAADFIMRICNGYKYVLLDEIFEDFITFYKKNTDEKSLAFLYASAWNTLFYHNDGCLNNYRDDSEKQKIILRWNKIEQTLYEDIRSIIDNEEINYPPTVLDKFDDPYFRIKPVMLRNGWTTGSTSRTWMRYTRE